MRDNVKKDGFVEEPVDGWQLLVARLASQSLAHLCAGEDIRAMPETEIPPAMRGDYYCSVFALKTGGRMPFCCFLPFRVDIPFKMLYNVGEEFCNLKTMF